MPLILTRRLFYAIRRNPSTVAELPSGISAIGWGLLAMMNVFVWHGTVIWAFPTLVALLGILQVWATLSVEQHRARFACCLLLSFLWLYLFYAAIIVLRHEAFMAVYFGMALANLYSAAELMADYAKGRMHA